MLNETIFGLTTVFYVEGNLWSNAKQLRTKTDEDIIREY